MRTTCPRSHMRGVTLMELLLVIGILSILSMIAVGSYRTYSLHANRSDATTSLMKIQAAQEKYYLQNNTYASSPTALGILTVSPAGFYNLTMAQGSTGDWNSFQATATAVNAQVQDTGCVTLTLNDQGTHAPATCWQH